MEKWKKRGTRSALSLYRRSRPYRASSVITRYTQTPNIATFEKGIQKNAIQEKRSTQSSQYSVLDFSNQSSHIREKLTSDEFLSSFCDYLEKNDQLKDFVSLAENLVSGNISSDNLAWSGALHRGRYSSCTSTTNMRYDTDYCEYFALIYLLFGSSALNVLRGPSHFGSVIGRKSQQGQFDPNTSKCNFSIPSVNILQKIDTGFAKKIDPGFIEDTIEQAKGSRKQYVLSFDGKKVSQGCRGDIDGDENLLGVEGPPSLVQAKSRLDSELASVKEIEKQVTKNGLPLHYTSLKSVLYNMSQRTRDMRGRLTANFFLEKKFQKMRDSNPNKKKSYEYTLGFLYKATNELESSSSRALNLNLDLCKLMAVCNRNSSLIPSSRYVHLHKQSNFQYLLPAEYVSKHMNLDLKSNSMYISQGSELWEKKRLESRITGSTMYSALGLDTLKAEKEHYYVHVKRRRRQPFDKLTKARIDFGNENEMNAISTLVGLLLPALKPPCYQFSELGPIFIDGIHRKKLIEVSCDGMISCSNGGENCPTCTSGSDNIIAVEAKCVYPDENLPKYPFYQLPVRYVTQCLAEMAALQVNELWLVCFTLESVSLLSVTFDKDLWQRLFLLSNEKYGPDNIPVPTRLHPESKALRQELKKFVQTNSRLICEVPSLRGDLQVQMPSHFVGPYSNPSPVHISEPNIQVLDRKSKSAADEGSLLCRRIHDILRIQSTEMLVFMLNDKDRMQEEFVPNSAPLLYAMKGKSLCNSRLRYLIDKTRNRLLDEGISILVEVYDGQWQHTVMTTSEGKPLTKLRLASTTWANICKMSKKSILDEMLSTCSIDHEVLDTLETTKLIIGPNRFENLHIEKRSNGSFDVTSLGGKKFKLPIARHFKSHTSNNVWNEHWKKLEQKKAGKIHEGRNKQQVGLRENEKSILSTLDPEVLADLDIELDESEGEEDLGEDELPDLIEQNENRALQKLLSSNNFQLLEHILEDLKEKKPDKWEGYTPSDLYPELLTSGTNLVQKCIKAELQIIGKAIQNYTGRTFFKSSMTKAQNANLISSAFQSTDFATERRRNTTRNPKTLSFMCKSYILDQKYPQKALAASHAEVVHCFKKAQWRADATVPLVHNFKTSFTSENVNMFSYPEFCTERNQLEFRTLDYSHILTNMRMHLCREGYTYCRGMCYKILATERPDILSKSVVFDKTDAQNVFTAIKFFSAPVEMYMRKKKFTEAANFIVLVRNWHRACDERGISANTRVRYLIDMYNFLLSGVNLDSFPPPGKYIKGMPVTTFEAILQNICTKIQLYSHAVNGVYNVRSVSTLSNESFFSDITRLDKEDRMYPKACNVGKLISRVVTLNYFKHSSDKSFHLSTSLKGVYPIHLTESALRDLMQQNEFNRQFRNHFFDYPNMHKSSRFRKDDISVGLAPLRNVEGVRAFHRTNESKILPHIREGMKEREDCEVRLQQKIRNQAAAAASMDLL